jgi:cytochrome c556
MRLANICAALALLFSTATFAQDMKAKSMPEKMDDNRQIVPLTEAESAIMAADMRQMLVSIQGVTDGLALGDMQAVVKAASKSGMAMMQELPSQIRMKFPEAFAQMGIASHKAFDQITQDAKTIKNPAPILRQLSIAMQNCVACHATYRFAPPK